MDDTEWFAVGVLALLVLVKFAREVRAALEPLPAWPAGTSPATDDDGTFLTPEAARSGAKDRSPPGASACSSAPPPRPWRSCCSPRGRSRRGRAARRCRRGGSRSRAPRPPRVSLRPPCASSRSPPRTAMARSTPRTRYGPRSSRGRARARTRSRSPSRSPRATARASSAARARAPTRPDPGSDPDPVQQSVRTRSLRSPSGDRVRGRGRDVPRLQRRVLLRPPRPDALDALGPRRGRLALQPRRGGGRSQVRPSRRRRRPLPLPLRRRRRRDDVRLGAARVGAVPRGRRALEADRRG